MQSHVCMHRPLESFKALEKEVRLACVTNTHRFKLSACCVEYSRKTGQDQTFQYNCFLKKRKKKRRYHM